MELPLYQIDAFTSRVFAGNPAAVCPLDAWLPDATMQAIAAENNLSETAYFVRENGGYRIRWFTPGVEVDLCGHATLASGCLLLTRLTPEADAVDFASHSGAAARDAQGQAVRARFSGARRGAARRFPTTSRAPCPCRRRRCSRQASDASRCMRRAAQIRALKPDMARAGGARS